MFARVSLAHEQDLIDLVRLDHSRSDLQRLLQPQPERHDRSVVPPHGALTMMREPPHPHVEEQRGVRLHPERRTGLHRQVVLRQLCEQRRGLVAPLVAHEIVERGPG